MAGVVAEATHMMADKKQSETERAVGKTQPQRHVLSGLLLPGTPHILNFQKLPK
jgi:hypothetical protein